MVGRSEANLAAVEKWVANTAWVDFLAGVSAQRSSTSICLKIVDPWFQALCHEEQVMVPGKLDAILDAEGAAYDINGYRDAPPGLRIWGGATVETDDLEALFPWLDWAYASVKASFPRITEPD